MPNCYPTESAFGNVSVMYSFSLSFQAVGSQFYFNSFRGSSYEKFNVFNQRTLRAYDKDLTDILDEVYSCFKGNNKYVHRCSWKSKCSNVTKTIKHLLLFKYGI